MTPRLPEGMPPRPTAGEQLDAITRRLDETSAAWVAAGYPDSGPEVDAREAVFADLRAWNAHQEHRDCVALWARLTDEQRAGTTFHGVDAHLAER